MDGEKDLDEMQKEAELLSKDSILAPEQPSSSDLITEVEEIPKVIISDKDQMEYLANVEKNKKHRSSIWLMIILSAINLVLSIANSNVEFPFSLVSSRIVIGFAYVEGQVFARFALVIMSVIAAFMILVYLIIHALARKHPIANIINLVLFSFDSILLIIVLFFAGAGDFVSLLLEVVAHAWIIAIFISLIKTDNKIKKYKKLYQ